MIKGCFVQRQTVNPDETPTEEHFETLLSGRQFRMERIVSFGHTTPQGSWYDQDMDEWVLLVSGSASVRFEQQHEPVRLKPGDYLWIRAHERHRVEWTDPNKPTTWLAVHFEPNILLELGHTR